MVHMVFLDLKAAEEHRVHLVLQDFLVLLAELDLQVLLELQDLQDPQESLGRKDLLVFVGTLALMGEWVIEDQLAPLVAQVTKGTQEKMDNLVQMVLLVLLVQLGKEELLECLDNVGSEGCLAFLAQRVHQEK